MQNPSEGINKNRSDILVPMGNTILDTIDKVIIKYKIQEVKFFAEASEKWSAKRIEVKRLGELRPPLG